jgi:hypothetical protein
MPSSALKKRVPALTMRPAGLEEKPPGQGQREQGFSDQPRAHRVSSEVAMPSVYPFP